MKTYKYKDLYDGYATLTVWDDGIAHLVICVRSELQLDKVYKSFRGARIAMGHWSDTWSLIKTA